MLTFNFSPFPVLTTDRLILRQTTQADAQEIFFLRSDAEVLKYIDREPATAIEQAVAFIDMINAATANNENISWAITMKGSDTLIGTIALWRLIKEHHRAEVGYVLNPAYYNKGIMSEALVAVLHYGFHTMRLHSVEANTNPENKASQRVLEKQGFVQEAYFRENYYHDGRFTDSAIHSLLTPLK